ncbi:MAG: hypothetical protein J7J75_01635 [Euryarchaeota archaeon]|nr:hypothetical protein [Euryarchaeota archaeon]
MSSDEKFTFKEFDERSYAETALKNVRLTLYVVGLGVLTALISTGISVTTIPYKIQIAFIPGIVCLFLLRRLYDVIGIPREDVKVSRYLWILFLYTITWIITWTTLVNIPSVKIRVFPGVSSIVLFLLP